MEKKHDRPTQTPTFVTFVHLPFYQFRTSDPLLLLIYLLGYYFLFHVKALLFENRTVTLWCGKYRGQSVCTGLGFDTFDICHLFMYVWFVLVNFNFQEKKHSRRKDKV